MRERRMATTSLLTAGARNLSPAWQPDAPWRERHTGIPTVAPRAKKLSEVSRILAPPAESHAAPSELYPQRLREWLAAAWIEWQPTWGGSNLPSVDEALTPEHCSNLRKTLT